MSTLLHKPVELLYSDLPRSPTSLQLSHSHGRSGLLTFTGSTGTCGEVKKQQQGEGGSRGGRLWGLAPAEQLHHPLPASSLPSSWWQGVPPQTCASCRDLGLVSVLPAAAHCLHNCWRSSGPCSGALAPQPPSHHSWSYSLLEYFLPLPLNQVRQSKSTSSFYIQKFSVSLAILVTPLWIFLVYHSWNEERHSLHVPFFIL